MPRTVLAAAVATTGSLSLADIAAAAERKAAERERLADEPDRKSDEQPDAQPDQQPDAQPDRAVTAA